MNGLIVIFVSIIHGHRFCELGGCHKKEWNMTKPSLILKDFYRQLQHPLLIASIPLYDSIV